MVRGKYRAATQASWGVPELRMVLQSCLELGQDGQAYTSAQGSASRCELPWRGAWLRWKGLLPLWQSSKGLTREDSPLTALPEAGATCSTLKGVWHNIVAAVLLQDDYKTSAGRNPFVLLPTSSPHFLQTLLLKFLGKSNKVLCHNNKR